MQQLFTLNKWAVFIFILIMSISFAIITQEIILTEDIYYDAFSEQITWERFEKNFKKQKDWVWLSYVLMPLVFVIKFSLVSACLFITTYLSNQIIDFKKFFGIVVVAELVVLLPTLIKVSWFVFIADSYTLYDVSYFAPWALSSFISITKDTDRLVIYLLQVFNLFEVVYIVFLAIGLQSVLQKTFATSLALTLKSYGLGLLLWITFVSFLIVSFS